MDIQEKIQQLDTLKNEIETLGKLSDEILKKVNYKFRLDWNYYSNQMEGGTLTKAETRSVMVGNIDVDKGKSLKDIFEMKGHDNVVLEIMKMGKGEVNISEKRIKELHTLIMHEEDPEKKMLVGNWKKEPNEIINYQDEKFQFTPVSEVKEAIHSLLNWLNAELDKIKTGKKDAMHPALLAFEFHLRYLTIHPFYDGNGRTARILMNMILIRLGYPPVIIKTEKKKTYYKYLADIQAYGGGKDLYYGFMLDLLQESLELVKNAIEGKNIEEADDLDKKLELLKKHIALKEESENEKKEKRINTIKAILNQEYFYLGEVLNVFDKFSIFFLEKEIGANVVVDEFPIDEMIKFDFSAKIGEGVSQNFKLEKVKKANIILDLKKLKSDAIPKFDVFTDVTITFGKSEYQIASNMAQVDFKKSYGELPTEKETKEFAQAIGNYIYDKIEKEIS